uniref:FTH domain-containing protein n=1 Tax=Caenorhabditis tropicalis TaxID=1561998 RepID=A0A1I7U3R2_9PELO
MTEICKTSKQKHCSDGQCQVIIDFLDECREFLHSKTIINVGFHAEFGKQLFNSLFALHRILINNVPPNKESLKIIKCEINPVNIYSLTPDDILTLFPLFPKHFKPMALDVICQNAIPETYSYILKLYGVEDYSNRKEKKANRTLILNALKNIHIYYCFVILQVGYQSD